MIKKESKSGFSSLHPAVSFVYFFVVIISALVFKHPLYLYTLFLAAILLNWTIDGGRALNKSIKNYLLLALLITFANPIFSNRGATILFYLFDRPITLEALVYGVQFGFSLLTILVLFVAYNLIVTFDRFLYLFGTMAPRTSFVIIVTIRFIPLLRRRAQDIMAIRKIQHVSENGRKKKQQLKEGMAMLHTLVTWSLEEALITASSMRARGYGIGKRSSAIRYAWDKQDFIVAVVMGFSSIVLLVGALKGAGQYDVYPELVAISFTTELLFYYGGLLCFVMIPIIINGKVWMKWQFIKLRM